MSFGFGLRCIRQNEEAASMIGIDVINLHHSDWTGGWIAMVHRFGLLAFGWDAQYERILEELLDSGIDGVYSDHVDTMMACIDAATN